MQSIETTIEVDEQGVASVRVATALSPGRHAAVLVVADEAVHSKNIAAVILPKHSLGSWPEGYTFSRDELYDERGR